MRERIIGWVLTAVAVAGAVIVLGAVGECENGGDNFQCVARVFWGFLLIACSMAGQAVRQCRGKEEER